MSSFSRPALPDLIARVTNNLAVNITGIIALLRRSVIGIIGKVFAQELYQEYAYLDFIANQFFTETAEGFYLDRKGSEVGVPRLAGGFATGPVAFAPTVGGTVPAGAILQTQGNRPLSFALNAAVTVTGSGPVNGTVTALQVGSSGNLAPFTPLVLVVAVAGVLPSPVVASAGFAGGLDEELDDLYRIRVLARQQQPPQGGASRDYVAWAKLYPGVTRAWVYPLARGPGTVDVAFVFDGRGRGTAAILPTGIDVAGVQLVLNANKPVVAGVVAVYLGNTPVNVVIGNLLPAAGFTKAQALVNAIASLTDLFGGVTPGFATYGDGIAPGATGGTLFVEQISDAITQSAGVGTFDLTSPTIDQVASNEQMLLLGTVTAP